ncbi:OmpH family outer membrane protein [Mucilaginibacter sp. McL0603]|uniref:OmpH family outer membrane protein n=1 Tax=Mucilaginibacter sp. McL0603 TaxID=3415670 RepID=UPI003CF258FD
MQKMNTPAPEKQKINYIKWSYHVLLGIAVLFLLSGFLFRNDKIAYVDSAKIFNEYKGSEEAKKAYQSKSKVWQGNIDTLTNEVKGAIQKYEKSVATMSKKEQDLSKQIIQEKQRQLAEYQRGIQENAKQENDKLTQSIVTQINAYLTVYGKKHNYKMILIANQSGTIAYARDGLDITQDVIDGLNAEYPVDKK